MTYAPSRAKLVGGVWLPDTETHLVDWMENSKRARVVDWKRTYQYHKLEAALRHQPEGRRRRAIDIGAHVGLWSMWLTRAFDYVEAFEPVPWFRDIFVANVDMDKCTVFGCALGFFGNELGDKGSGVSLNVPLETTGAAHVAGRHSINQKFDPDGLIETVENVELMSLDAFNFPQVDFIKIDVEGLEAEVVRGAERTIREYRPNLVVECKGNDVAYGEIPQAAVKILKSWGMKPLEVISGDWIMGW